MAALMALCFITPAVANAQVTVKHVKVVVTGTASKATYCDLGTLDADCDVHLWNLTTPVNLSAGQTLVLTQTGLIPNVGDNFDTSDRAQGIRNPTVAPCNSSDQCTVNIYLITDTGSTFPSTPNYNPPIHTGDPINNNNDDSGASNHCEGMDYGAAVVTAPNYTLKLGYADTEHGAGCIVPSIFDGIHGGSTKATVFIGDNTGHTYDAGVLLITALPTTNVCVEPQFGLSSLEKYAVFGLDRANVIFGSGATKITGDVGIGPLDTGSLIKATVVGKLFLHSTASPDIHSDLNVTGGIQTGPAVDTALQSGVAAALAANTALNALAPDQFIGNITGNKIITLSATTITPGLNVVRVDSVNTVSGKITIIGTSTQSVVLQVSGQFNCNGCSIVLTGGLTAQHVIWNFLGTGGDVDISKPVGATSGIFLAPGRSILLDKAANIGALIGAQNGQKLLVHSGATLTNPCAP